MTKPLNIKQVLTPEDLSARYGGSPSVITLRKWRNRGIGPKHFYSGPGKTGRVFYRLADVKIWEKERSNDS